MQTNLLYNLMCQLVHEEKSLWRMKSYYLKDAKDCKECQTFWKKVQTDKESLVEELTQHIKKHLK